MRPQSFRNNLRQERQKQKLSQRELARRVRMHHPAICRIERGERVPTYATMKKLAGVLKVNVPDIFSNDYPVNADNGVSSFSRHASRRRSNIS
ncbi:helix-turn-helix transcriptional regulator [Candidatus Peregrinibacteria bacterium]|nr:helix-turn-helix transcriptional regulator [Candidatus Peregrinibacteria bacterium]